MTKTAMQPPPTLEEQRDALRIHDLLVGHDIDGDSDSDEWDPEQWDEDDYDTIFDHDNHERHPNADSSASPQGHWVYQGLTHPREFRLLLLQPGLFGEPIRCNLVHKMFSTMTPIEYEAISYTWADESGDSTPSKTIYLGGCLFSVTPNCEAVLKRVRARGRLRVWIDAVCINQHDTDERGHQVHLMPDIYSLAERVLIYPGELSDKEAKNLETLNSLDVSNTARVGHFPPSPTGLSPLQKTVLDAVDRVAPSFFKRRYFSRVWILQEVSLAREALVLCDGYEISLDYFRTSAIYKARSEAPRVLRIEPRKFRQESDLLELLNDARDSKATDSRDKVFGVFGMIQLASQSFGLVANYNASVEDTYIEAALNIAETLSRTDGRGILKLIVRAMGPRNYPALPAWVPDWSAVPYPEVVQTLPAARPWDPPSLLTAALDVYHDYPRLQNVIVDKRQREISFNGAQFCSLEKLVNGGCFRIQVLIPGREQIKTLPREDFERLIESEKADMWHCYSFLYPELGGGAKSNNRLFLLSSSPEEFRFLGLCFVESSSRPSQRILYESWEVRRYSDQVLDILKSVLGSSQPDLWFDWEVVDFESNITEIDRAITVMLDIMFERVEHPLDRRLDLFLTRSRWDSDDMHNTDLDISREMFWWLKTSREEAGQDRRRLPNLDEEFWRRWAAADKGGLIRMLRGNSDQADIILARLKLKISEHKVMQRVRLGPSGIYFNSHGGFTDLLLHGSSERNFRTVRLRLTA